MEVRSPAPKPAASCIHAETKLRNQHFVMSGHHCHPCCELFYVESGACRFLIDDHIFDLQAGDFIFVPPAALHYTRYLFGPCRRTVILFPPEEVPEEVRDCMPREGRFFLETSVFQVPEAYRSLISGCFRRLASEEKITDLRSGPVRRACLAYILLICSRVCRFLSEPPADIHTSDQQVLRAAGFISENYMNQITTADVAGAVGFSANYLSRRFRTATGIDLHEYLVFIRLQHAAQELLSTQDSVTTIALRCGFSNSNYFKDAFKKKYGLTPRAYRKRA